MNIVLRSIARLTPLKSLQKVYDKEGRPLIVRQTWGDYIYSKVTNQIRLKIKYGGKRRG